MNLDQWSALKRGDVVRFCDKPEIRLRLVTPLEFRTRQRHQSWPEGWNVETPDGDLPEWPENGILHHHWRDFLVLEAA